MANPKSKNYGVTMSDRIQYAWMDFEFSVARAQDRARRKADEKAKKAAAEAEAVNNTTAPETENAEPTAEQAAAPAAETKQGKKKTDKKGLFSFLKKNKKEEAEVAASADEAPVAAQSSEAEPTKTEEEEVCPAPEEEIGAEKISETEAAEAAETPAAEQAAQATPNTGFNIGGAQFSSFYADALNPDHKPTILKEEAETIFPNQQLPTMDPMTGQVNVQQPFNPMAGQMNMQQPFNTAVGAHQAPPQQFVQQNQPHLHRVDAPATPVKPKAPRSEADVIQMNQMGVAEGFVDPSIASKPVKEPASVIQPNVVHAVDSPSESFYNNAEITSKYPYMKQIEELALKNHLHIKMEMIGSYNNPYIASGMIACMTVNEGSSQINEQKSFVIDTGCIIDKRVKLYPGLYTQGYEKLQAYSVLLPCKDNKSKSEFNTALFEKIFTGGILALDGKGMYSNKYLDLNKVVDLITMPTQKMNGERRKQVQDRLIRSLEKGVFESAVKMAESHTRFSFKPDSYNPSNGTFILTNANTPIMFNGPILSAKPVEIRFGVGPGSVFVAANPEVNKDGMESMNKPAETQSSDSKPSKKSDGEKKNKQPKKADSKDETPKEEPTKKNDEAPAEVTEDKK